MVHQRDILKLKYNEAYLLLIMLETNIMRMSSEIFHARKDRDIYYKYHASSIEEYELFIDRYYDFPGTTTAIFCVENKYILIYILGCENQNRAKDDSFIKRERLDLMNITKDDIYYYKYRQMYSKICNFIDLHPKMRCDWCVLKQD